MAARVADVVRVLTLPLAVLERARGSLFPWVPVLIGCGIGWWFALPWEPSLGHYVIALCVIGGAVACWWLGPDILQPLWVIGICLAVGWVACGVRVWIVATPMLEFRYYGPVTGRVVEIDRSQTDALRLTLDDVCLERVSFDRTPVRVRISLRGRSIGYPAGPGDVIMLTAHLSAPDGPAEPGTFDFRRMAFFDGLGAVGYTTAPIVLWQSAAPAARPIDRLRSHLSAAMMKAMPSQAGAFAAGAMTGDRSGITQDTVADLRDSSLAHLLAISGMNLAFLIGFVFALIRYGLALVPFVALRINTKKVAAWVSLAVAAFYLALSGANVATERAFIMVCVVLGAVLLDRKALTLRSAALAGIILLLWQPESLLEPGFQMSFAATVALIAGFREMDRRVAAARMPRWVSAVFTLVLSSVIGGVATAPYAAAHFNRFTDYGLVANLLTVPVMGAVVMPSGAVAALLAPVGLADLPLWVMERGAAWILMIAHWVAGWEGAVTPIPAPPTGSLGVLTLGALWIILWRGWGRALGVVPIVAALVLWSVAARPAILISGDGALVGVLGPDGRALSAKRGAGFAARNWLENDGDLVGQDKAAARAGLSGAEGERQFLVSGVTGIALKGRGAADRLANACVAADIVIISALIDDPPRGCLVLDQRKLRQTGPLALHPAEGGLRVELARAAHRVWSPPARPTDLPDVVRPSARPKTVAPIVDQ